MKRFSKQFAGTTVIVILAVLALAVSVPLSAYAAPQSWDNTRTTCSWYLVRRGDTLTKISNRYGVSIRSIQLANGLRSTRIYTNTRLCIPITVVTPPPCNRWNCRPPQPPPPPPCYWNCNPRPQPCYWNCFPPTYTRWNAEFFQGLDTINGPLLVQVPGFSSAASFYWWNGSPYPGIPGGGWSLRLTENVYLNGGMYNFTSNSDNGVLVWLDQTLVINNWSGSPSFTANGATSTGAGQHLITIAYRHPGGPAQLNVNWWPQQ
jgi:LysM repeat protein